MRGFRSGVLKMAKIPVNDLFAYLEMMLREDWGYIWGTAGVMWTAEKQKRLEDTYSVDDLNRGKSVRYGSKWIGHTVTDCSGVLVYIGLKYGIKYPHGSTSMVEEGYLTDWDTKPHPGWAALVDPTPETANNNHIGYVGRDGITVYEAKGTIDGFVTSKASDKKWTKFCRIRDVDYSAIEKGESIPMLSEYYYAEITGDDVRIRTGPGTNYAKIGTNLNKGDIVKVVAEPTDKWVFAQVEGQRVQGYIFKKYVQKIDPPVVEEPAAKDPTIELDATVALAMYDMLQASLKEKGYLNE